MEKIYVGKLMMAHRVSNIEVTEKTELRFENGEVHFDDPFKLRQEYYVVEKSELDAYMARKESLEKTKGTPEWYLSNRLKQLEAENANLKEKIKELGVIKSFLEVGNEKWIVCNTELRSRNRNLELENAKLRGELSRADDELAKYSGVQEVVDIRTTNDQDSYVLWWTGRNGDEHKLELKLVQNPMSEKMRREMDIYD